MPVTYAVGSTEDIELKLVNSEITRCGYSAYAPVRDLTAAAIGHANYMTVNGGIITHDQTSGRPGFTGTTHRERILAAGGSQTRALASSEGISATYVGIRQPYSSLLNGPMHQADILDGYSEIGVGLGPRPINQVGVETRLLNLVYGGPKRNTVPVNGVRTYPCEGSNLVTTNGIETPNPLPQLSDFGPALTFETNMTGSLEVDSIAVYEVSTNNALQTVRAIGPAGYTLEMAKAWRSTFVTTLPLKMGTQYRVEARGRTWATANKTGPATSWTRSYNFSTLGNPF